MIRLLIQLETIVNEIAEKKYKHYGILAKQMAFEDLLKSM